MDSIDVQIEKSWLQHKISLEEAIEKVTHPDLGKIERHRSQELLVPKLKQLFATLEKSDEVWCFHSNDGRKLPFYYHGFAVVRNGEIVDGIIRMIHVSYAYDDHSD